MKIRKRFTISLVGAGLLLTLVPAVAQTASAATPSGSGTGSYVTNAAITIDNTNKTYHDGNTGDGTHTFYLNGNTATPKLPSCSSEYIGFKGSDGGSYPGTGILYVAGVTGSGANQTCTYTATEKLALDTTNLSYGFVWSSSTTIVSADGRSTFTQQSGTTFKGSGTSGCSNTIVVASTNSSQATTGQWNNQTKSASSRGHIGGCVDHTQTVQIAAQSTTSGVAPPAGTTTCSDGSAEDANGNCGTTNQASLDCGGGALNWLVCPAITFVQGAAEQLDNFITGSLNVDAHTIFDTSGYYTAWSSFRVIATALIVIAGIVMVAAQAFGAEILDAYTIRKVLPRLLVAIIGISLSWPLLKFAVTFFDAVGLDVRGIIYGPFQTIHPHINTSIGIGSSLGAILGSITIFSIYGPAAFTFIIAGLLSLFLAFIIIVIRQVAIIALIILAPVAIACYILPNTQRAWKLWYDNFLGLMLVFPVISALIATGHVFAIVSLSNGGGISQVIGIVAYFVPYFLLPFAFRLVTGAIGNIAGMVNDRSRGVFDRMRKGRENSAAKNIHDMKTGNRFKGDNLASNAFNATTRNAANLPNAGFIPWKMRSRMQSAAATNESAELAEYMEKNAAFTSIKGNDDYLQATMKNMGGGNTEGDWRRYLSSKGYEGRALEQGVAQIRAAKRNVSNEVFERAAVMANSSTGTGWKEGGTAQMMESINEAAGGDRHTANVMLAQMRGMASQAGRLDLAGSGFGVQSQQLERMYQESAQTGSVSDATKADVKHQLHANLLETKGAGEFARARGQAVQQIAPEMLYDLRQAHAKVAASAEGTVARRNAERELAQKYASVANFHDSLNHMAPENAKLIADGVLSQKIYAGDTSDVMARIDEYRRTQNPDYMATRKDYDARQYREQGGPGGPMNPGEPQ